MATRAASTAGTAVVAGIDEDLATYEHGSRQCDG